MVCLLLRRGRGCGVHTGPSPALQAGMPWTLVPLVSGAQETRTPKLRSPNSRFLGLRGHPQARSAQEGGCLRTDGTARRAGWRGARRAWGSPYRLCSCMCSNFSIKKIHVNTTAQQNLRGGETPPGWGRNPAGLGSDMASWVGAVWASQGRHRDAPDRAGIHGILAE